MKKMMCLLMSLLTTVLLVIPAFAYESDPEWNGRSVYSYTMDEAQDMLLEYLEASGQTYEIGSVEYYNFICNQLLETSDTMLANLPNYSIIHSYMAMYKNAYEYDLWMNYGNSVANVNTLQENFNVGEEFLNQTIGEIRTDMLQEENAAENNRGISPFSAYNATSAVNYARKYAKDHNTSEYPSFSLSGGDCTNFVSQCLYAGGKPMDGTCTTGGVYQNTSDWFMKKFEYQDSWSYMVDYGYTTSWVNAGDFKSYWLSRCDDYSYEDDVDGIISACAKGDIVQLCDENTRSPYHSIIITAKSGNTAEYCAHSLDRIDYAVNESHMDSANNDFIVYNF